MMLHKASVLKAGGIEITETVQVQTERERAPFEARGFRSTPLEAIDALEATQTDHATLAAERNYELQRMSPRARAEVAEKEAEAGAVHLPTIPETPIGPRRVPVLTDRAVEETLRQNAADAIETQQAEIAAQQAEIARLTVQLAAAKMPAGAPKKRGRPKKVTEGS